MGDRSPSRLGVDRYIVWLDSWASLRWDVALVTETTGTGYPDESRIRDSPSVQMAVTLLAVYVGFALAGGSLELNPDVAWPFMQINQLVWRGWVWMLFTAMFLHADIIHLSGNVLFLLIFGTSLE